jgi:hypothetical protein
MTTGAAKPTAAQIVDGYAVLFPPTMRAAHLACLGRARALGREGGWPTVLDCLDTARLFDVPAAELAAFFGHLGYVSNRRAVWVDALHGAVSSVEAQQRITDAQARAFGFLCAFTEAVATDRRAAGTVH